MPGRLDLFNTYSQAGKYNTELLNVFELCFGNLFGGNQNCDNIMIFDQSAQLANRIDSVAVNHLAHLGFIIINKPKRSVMVFRIVADFAKQKLTAIARAVN